MTKSYATMEANQNVATAADNRLALFKISSSRKPRIARHTWVSREKFIELMLSHQKLERCDDHLIDLCGLMDPATGDCFIIEEEELLEKQTA